MNSSAIPVTGHKRGMRLAVAAAAFALAFSLSGVPAAEAATATLTQTQGVGTSKIYWQTQRTNAYSKNHVAFQLNSMTQNTCGGGLVMEPRNTSSAVPGFAHGDFTAPASKPFINNNGNSWQPSGAFWMTTQVIGQGCSGQTVTWSGTLTYSVRVI